MPTNLFSGCRSRKPASRFLFGCLILLTGLTQEVSAQGGKGILFRKDPLTSLAQLASAEKKAIFIELYSPDCHVCQSFEPTWNDNRVGDFYNRRFVSRKLDIAAPETARFLHEHRLYVPSLPLLLFLDSTLAVRHAQVVSNSVNDVIAAGEKVFRPGGASSDFPVMFTQGERHPNFLIEYGFFSRIVCDSVANRAAMEAYAAGLPAAEYGSRQSFLVLQKIVTDAFNPLFQYMMTHKAEFERAHTPKAVRETGENIVMTTLYRSDAGQFSPVQFSELRKYLVALGIPESEVTARTLVPELNAALRRQDVAEVRRLMNQPRVRQTTDPDEVVYLAGYVGSRVRDAAVLKDMSAWCGSWLQKKTSEKQRSELSKVKTSIDMALKGN